MVAGSETGAIIAGALITPVDKDHRDLGPRYSGSDVLKWFENEIDYLYKDA